MRGTLAVAVLLAACYAKPSLLGQPCASDEDCLGLVCTGEGSKTCQAAGTGTDAGTGTTSDGTTSAGTTTSATGPTAGSDSATGSSSTTGGGTLTGVGTSSTSGGSGTTTGGSGGPDCMGDMGTFDCPCLVGAICLGDLQCDGGLCTCPGSQESCPPTSCVGDFQTDDDFCGGCDGATCTPYKNHGFDNGHCQGGTCSAKLYCAGPETPGSCADYCQGIGEQCVESGCNGMTAAQVISCAVQDQISCPRNVPCSTPTETLGMCTGTTEVLCCCTQSP